jgi:hypothetical protein
MRKESALTVVIALIGMAVYFWLGYYNGIKTPMESENEIIPILRIEQTENRIDTIYIYKRP